MSKILRYKPKLKFFIIVNNLAQLLRKAEKILRLVRKKLYDGMIIRFWLIDLSRIYVNGMK